METIKDLLRIVTPNKIRHLPISFNSQDWPDRLFKILTSKSHKEITDTEAEKQLFGEDANSRTYYYGAKDKLRDKLLNSLFFIKPDDNNSTLSNEMFRIQKAYCAMNISRYFGLPKVAKSIAEKHYKIALEFSQVKEALGFSLFLKHYFGAIDVNEKKFQKYSQIIPALLELQDTENRTYNIYLDLIHEISKKKTVPEKTKTKVAAYSSQLGELLKTKVTFRTAFFGYSIQYYSAELHEKPKQVIEICENGLNYFSTFSRKVSKPAIFSFSYRLYQAYIKQGELEKAEALINKSLDLVKQGSFNWMLNYWYLSIVAFHQGKIELVNNYIDLVKSKGKFQYGRMKENWTLINTYAHLFQVAQDLPFKTKSIRPTSFLNEFENYYRDKVNTYFNARLIHFLLCLQQGKHDLLIEQNDGLQMYAFRYLKKTGSMRAYFLIKALTKIPKFGFDMKKAVKKAEPWITRLKEEPKAKQDIDLELVPFMVLWNLCIGEL